MSNERIDLTQFEKHTGPWLLIDGDIYKGGPKGTHKSDNMIADTAFGGYEAKEVRDADSRLMAAGPDLLAELKRCYDLLDKIAEQAIPDNEDPELYGYVVDYEVINSITDASE